MRTAKLKRGASRARMSTIEGMGEILRIQSRPAAGERKITVDPDTNLISDEIFKNAAHALRGRHVRRHAAARKLPSPLTTAPIRSGRRRFSTC